MVNITKSGSTTTIQGDGIIISVSESFNWEIKGSSVALYIPHKKPVKIPLSNISLNSGTNLNTVPIVNIIAELTAVFP